MTSNITSNTDQCTELEDSVFETTLDDDNDISYVSSSKFIAENSESIVFLDLNYAVIVEDVSHATPIASDEDLDEISDRFLKSLKVTSHRNADRNRIKHKLWSPNRNQFSIEEEADDQAILSIICENVESKEIKLKIPIPTYMLPVEYRKNKPNGEYSPITRTVLNTPKSTNRKMQLNRTTTFIEKICGFLESLDGKTDEIISLKVQS